MMTQKPLVFSAVLAAAICLAIATASSGQDIPRMPDGKPDFSGVWSSPTTVNPKGPRGQGIFNADKMGQVKPGGEALLYEKRTGDARHDEPRAVCMPSGFPSGMLYALPVQIVQTPKYIVIIHELQRATRIIPLDARPHRQNLEPSYYGDSIGRWRAIPWSSTLRTSSVGFSMTITTPIRQRVAGTVTRFIRSSI